MAISTIDTCSDHGSADEPLGVIAAAELAEAQRDPAVVALGAKADRYLAELERKGLSR